MAQTPFHIEGANMRLSALRYQERARQALTADADRPRDAGRLSVHAQRDSEPVRIELH